MSSLFYKKTCKSHLRVRSVQNIFTSSVNFGALVTLKSFQCENLPNVGSLQFFRSSCWHCLYWFRAKHPNRM